MRMECAGKPREEVKCNNLIGSFARRARNDKERRKGYRQKNKKYSKLISTDRCALREAIRVISISSRCVEVNEVNVDVYENRQKHKITISIYMIRIASNVIEYYFFFYEIMFSRNKSIWI